MSSVLVVGDFPNSKSAAESRMDFCCVDIPPEAGQLYVWGEGRLKSGMEGQHSISSAQINSFFLDFWENGGPWPWLSSQQWIMPKTYVRLQMMIPEFQFPFMCKFVCSDRISSLLIWEISASLTYVSVTHVQSVVISIQSSTAWNKTAWKKQLQFNGLVFRKKIKTNLQTNKSKTTPLPVWFNMYPKAQDYHGKYRNRCYHTSSQ